jgi:hypothetical protein
MISIHTMIITIAALNGFNAATNHFKLVANPLYNLFSIINIVIEVMFYMLVAYKFPLTLVFLALVTDPMLNKAIVYILKKWFTTLVPSLNWE